MPSPCPRYSEDDDLALISQALESFGLRTERFSSEELGRTRTPDFRIFRELDFFAYCEVKSPQDPRLDEELLNEAEEGEIVGGLRQDPTFNRIARHTLKAVSQFDAVNPERAHPNILAFANHDTASNYNDLVETVTGDFVTSNGDHIPTMRHISEGRLGEAKYRVDAFMWFDVESTKIQGWLLNERSLDFCSRVRQQFALS